VPFELLRGDWSRAVGDAAAAGHSWIVVAWVPESERRSSDDWRRLADLLDRSGAAARTAGVRFAYHNQEYDFKPVETATPFDVIATGTQPANVDLELDVYWAVKGGGDPLATIDRYPGRIPLMHFKDAGPPPSRAMVDVGAGTIDWKSVLARGPAAGLRHVFVEHDTPADAFASVRAGFAYLNGVTF
jgi:sugar phosphate isomerase/epimerase